MVLIDINFISMRLHKRSFSVDNAKKKKVERPLTLRTPILKPNSPINRNNNQNIKLVGMDLIRQHQTEHLK